MVPSAFFSVLSTYSAFISKLRRYGQRYRRKMAGQKKYRFGKKRVHVNNSVMSDIKFAFPSKLNIPAHKYILANSSPFFFAMFYGGLADKRESIDITDCDPVVFLQLLRYLSLYCDDVNCRDVSSAIQVWYQTKPQNSKQKTQIFL